MSKQANPAAIGGFVLGALVLTLIAIVVFGSGALLRERVPMVTYFPGSVQGLTVGAQVQFEGVGVGQVTGIALDYSPDGGFSIPVSYEVWPERVRIQGTQPDESAAAILRRLVREQGLHARLEALSFVTGQYGIALSLVPGRVSPLQRDPPDAVEVPSLEATRDRVAGMLGNLRLDALVNEATLTLVSLRQLIGSGEVARLVANLNLTLETARGLLAHLEAEVGPLSRRLNDTLDSYGTLAAGLDGGAAVLTRRLETTGAALEQAARRVDAELGPLSDAAARTLDDASRTLRTVNTLADDAAETRVQLDRFLAEASQTARALRGLADYLERHPEALLRGKR